MELKHIRRLLKLARHLESGKRGHRRFDFSRYTDSTEPGQCGTAGCAIGECPIVFPNHWQFAEGACLGYKINPRLVGHSHLQYSFQDARDFFGLDDLEARHLFIPYYQDTSRFAGEYLNERATAKEVAANIRAFIETKR